MFQKVLIANRGEIALRVNRACHELGLQTVAVYSTADKDSLHVKFADESVCIGPPSPKESYLNIQSILAAAELTGAQAIHPGYGFLSENAEFARICKESGLVFIGPSPEAIDSMGHKIKAKDKVMSAGVPVLPSIKLKGELTPKLKEEIIKVGFPVLIKAAMGGGGRGMKIVRSIEELGPQLEVARSESKNAFGSDEVYIEKYLQAPRHIEIQVLGDQHGNVIHLGERDCSIQRRHQKLLEEAPSPVLSAALRKKMGETAVAAAKAVNYSSTGTVEFIVDSDLNFYFLEMNTRIQVEHPVTEMITGVDLVREQIRSALGKELRYSQSDIQWRGHSIECRVTAEDPRTFAPNPGQIKLFHPPMGYGVRLESTACSDYFVPPYYDSMIAKLIVHDENREMAIEKMKGALREFIIHGVKTTIPLHLDLMSHPDFRSGRYDTGFLARLLG